MKAIFRRAAVQALSQRTRIGVEVGHSAIKLVELQQVNDGLSLNRVAVEPLQEGVLVEGQIRDHARLTDALRSLRVRMALGRVPVITAIPDNAVQYKVMRVDREMDPRTVMALAHKEARTLIRDPELQVSVDVAHLGEPVVGTQARDILLVAAKSTDVVRFATCFRRAGWEPEVIDVDGLVVRHGVRQSLPDEYVGSTYPLVAVFDLGAGGVALSVTRHEELVFYRSMAWPDPSIDFFGEQAAVGPLIDCVRQLTQAFHRQTGIEHLDRLQVTGGLSQNEPYVTEIADWIGLPVERWRIEDQVNVPSTANPAELGDLSQRLFVALSLAKRGFE